MKSLLLLFSMMFILVFCAPKEKELTAEQITQEKQAIVKVMKEYNDASEAKSWSRLVETLASEVRFYGTDSAEVINTFDEYREKIMTQWNLFDKQKYGEMTNIHIQMDPNASFASIIYGIPFDVTIGEKVAHLFLRIQRTLKKENDKWVIVRGIVGSTDPKQALILQQILEEKATGQQQPAK
ncbi:MAG: nuclear transport factor 2 family protein [Ignavibacteriae bacterium]|nr:nuclear transport factor 2 family protein [Ignavibacteriota bacterium]